MLGDVARVTLAGIRIFNGTAGLVAPSMLSKRLDSEDAAGPMGYPFRMFGVRTILIGVDLLSRDRDVRRHAVLQAPLIHASDTISAWAAGKSRRVAAEGREDGDDDLGRQPRARADRLPLGPLRTPALGLSAEPNRDCHPDEDYRRDEDRGGDPPADCGSHQDAEAHERNDG